MRKAIWAILLVAALSGCTSLAPTPTTVPTTVAESVATAIPPSATPSLTDTPSPTDTPTLTPSPTATPTNTPTPEPTETPEPTATREPTATPLPDVARFPIDGQFEIFGDDPVVSRHNAGSNSRQYTDPGTVLFHEGRFHMFHNAFTGWPAKVDVMYSVSEDGVNWTLAQEEPVFVADDLDYVGVTALASSALVLEDGTWALYLYTWEDQTWPTAGSTIGMATASSPFGPWQADDAPILSQGAEGEWDDLGVRTPSVVKTADGYEMFYAGWQRRSASIGRAFSADGYTWTKYDDPETTAAPFANSDPVFVGRGSAWDRAAVYQPRVRLTQDGWVMLYTAATSIGGSSLFQEHGLAFSNDGNDWSRSETIMFKANEVTSSGGNIWYTELEYALGTYFIYFELGIGNNTEIYLATFDPSLLPK